jgi:hypothetical protein
MANIENPAAIFSAEGLKIFIEMIQANGSAAVLTAAPEDQADKLVKEWFEHEPKKEKGKTANKDKAAQIAYNFIAGLEGIFEPTTKEIQTSLEDNGIFDFSGKRMGAFIRMLRKRYPEIKKTESNTYIIETKAAAENE